MSPDAFPDTLSPREPHFLTYLYHIIYYTQLHTEVASNILSLYPEHLIQVPGIQWLLKSLFNNNTKTSTLASLQPAF